MDKLPSFSQILELFAVIIVLGNVIKAIGTIINPLKRAFSLLNFIESSKLDSSSEAPKIFFS